MEWRAYANQARGVPPYLPSMKSLVLGPDSAVNRGPRHSVTVTARSAPEA